MLSIFKQINEGIHDACYIWAKEMKTTVHDEGVLIFFLLVPLFYPLLYSWAYNNEVVREVPVAIVDQSNSHQSRLFIRQYDASPNVKVAYKCNSLTEAKELVQQQSVKGILYFPPEYDRRLHRTEQATVTVYCDMSLMLAYKAIYQTATAVAQAVGSNLLPQSDDNQGLTVEEVQLFNPTGGYGSFLIPAVLILIIQQTLVLGIGLSAGTARENNRYQDLVPISQHYNGLFRIVLGKAMAYFMVAAVTTAWLILVIPRLFHFTTLLPRTSLFDAQATHLLLPYILASIFFGMFVSCIVRYRENIILLVVFASLPLLFLTGLSWPQSSIPGYWQGFSWLFPSTFGVRAFVRISSMGATLQDVTSEYVCLWVQTIVYFLATCAVYRYQLLHTRRHARQQLNDIKQRANAAKQSSVAK